LRIEALIDLTLDKAMEDEADHERSGDKRQRDEHSRPDQEPPAEGGVFEFHKSPEVRR
jgi:hypothetical protein